MHPPEHLPETSPLTRWLNHLRRYAISLTPRRSHDIAPDHSSGGVLYRFINQGGGGGSDFNLKRAKLKEIHEAYLVCIDVDDEGNETGDTFNVIKPLGLRADAAVPEDATLSASSATTRTLDYSLTVGSDTVATTASQAITPAYEVDGFIWITDGFENYTQDDPDGDRIEWLDLNLDARHWEFAMVTVALCVRENGQDVLKYAAFRGTEASNL